MKKRIVEIVPENVSLPSNMKQVNEKATPATPVKKKRATRRGISLTNFSHIREEMSRIYRDARVGKIEPGEATKLAFILGELRKIIEIEQFQNRLFEVERKLLTYEQRKTTGRL